MSQAIENKEDLPTEPRGVAYSYVRFSTVKQELGDSLRRQVEACEKYCREHNLELHPVSYRDLGVSAFKRKNLEKGALASFIEAVNTGKVEKGSYLIIEQFDRLSRAQTSIAMQLLLNLINAGIRVVTLDDKVVWDSEAVNGPTGSANLVMAIIYMSRANNESQAKADRLSEVWGKKKAGAADGTARRIVTSECPRWLAPTEDKKGFIVLDDKVESVKKVFQMRIDGHGITHIVSTANEQGWPVPGKPPVKKSGESDADFELRKHVQAWHTSNVGRLLKNRALLGEYQPHINDPEDENKRIPVGEPIKGYYPQVLDEETFLRAQAVTDRHGRFPGRRDASLKNWLQGILRCSCGHSFVRKNKDSEAQPGYARYYCTARNRNILNADGTKCPGASAKELEAAVLHVVAGVAPAYFDGSARVDELKTKIDLLSLDLTAAKTTRDRFVEAIALSTTAVKALTERVNKAHADVERIEKELNAARAELADLSGDFDSVFENIVKQVQHIDSLDARAKLREELSRVIEKVVVHQNEGFIEVHLRGNEVPIVQPLRPDAMLPGLGPAV